MQTGNFNLIIVWPKICEQLFKIFQTQLRIIFAAGGEERVLFWFCSFQYNWWLVSILWSVNGLKICHFKLTWDELWIFTEYVIFCYVIIFFFIIRTKGGRQAMGFSRPKYVKSRQPHSCCSEKKYLVLISQKYFIISDKNIPTKRLVMIREVVCFTQIFCTSTVQLWV